MIVQCVEDYLFTHNKDPTNAVSAWDQMNTREIEMKKAAQEELEKLDSMIEDLSPSRVKEYDSQNRKHNVDRERIEREYSRQKKALIAAREKRERLMSRDFENELSGDDNFSNDSDIDDKSYNETKPLTSSRYKNDFIQLEKLGKGGGGEVVKVRNRLDRRIYAVKKVILQSEYGKMEKVGKLENAKLKREVTTISRMTHKNIVRYYQAWVEEGEKTDEHSKIDVCQSDVSVKNEDKSSNNSRDTSESSKSRKGFWMSSFHDVESMDSSASWSDDEEISNSTPYHDAQNDDFDFIQSPLLDGCGFGDKVKANGYQRSSSESGSNSFGESESEADTSKTTKLASGRGTLYIQMEYCSSTLRNLIDDASLQKMDNDDVWKVVVQILEALDYIHKVRHMLLCLNSNFYFSLITPLSIEESYPQRFEARKHFP